MKVAVIIVNWNAAADTRRCVASVEAWRLSEGVPAPRIWVVDNGSIDPGLEALRREHPGARVLVSSVNRGFAGGSNMGVVAALAEGYDAILLLNNDATLHADSLASMVATLTSSPMNGVVGPALWDGDRLLSVGGRDIARHAVTHNQPCILPASPVEVDHVSGTAVLIHRRVFDQVGLLDEDFFFGGELADLCRRARQRGLRSIADPCARAQHDLRRSSVIRERLHIYYVVRNRFLYIRKHRARRRRQLYLLWSLRGMQALALAVLRGQRHRARAIALGLVDGLSGRFGGQNERVLG